MVNISDVPPLRLYNQGITRPVFASPVDVVDWLVAVQSQDFAGAKWAVGLRMQTATDALVEQAFDQGQILRTHLLRPTWHFVTPADIRWLLALTAPRVHQVNGTMYRRLGVDSTLARRSNDAIAKALQGGHQRTRDELRDMLHQAGFDTSIDMIMSYYLMNAELEGIICSGPRQGKQFTYMLLEERAPQARSLERDEALAELTRRFFISRGPATAQDFAKWSGLTLTDVRAGLEMVKAVLQQVEISGVPYWLAPSDSLPRPTAPLAHMLSIYDEYISSYQDRSAIVSGENGAKLMAMGNALTHIIVVDGQIVGTWKRTQKKSSVLIETNLFRQLTGAEQQAVTAAAKPYGAFLERPVVFAV